MTRIAENLIYPELSYKITGILFEVHNKLNRYCKEKQYKDAIEEIFKRENVKYEKEKKLTIEIWWITLIPKVSSLCLITKI